MKAIKQYFETLQLVVNNYTIREEILDGKTHIVVPVVMMVEGVHSGSHGPTLHKEAELAKWTEAWNGRPVTVSHPTDGKVNVSANDPEVVDDWTVGRIFNAYYEDGLKAEAWIDVEKISEKSPEAHGAILDGSPLEVSVGVFNDTEIAQEGAEWNGETYEQIASNYRPDHLALLPGDEGACSWRDGCGVRVNKKGGTMPDALFTTFKELNAKGYVVSLLNNAQGYMEILQALRTKVDGMDTDDAHHYIEEVYDDSIVYRKMYRNGSGGETLYKQNYNVDVNKEITFDGMSSEVRKKVEYVSYKMKRKPNVNNSKQGGTMSTEKSLCCEAKVDALIANKRTHWQAADREWLLTQDEGTIAKMSPMAAETVEQTAEEIQANKDQVIADYNAGRKTVEDYTKDMPEAMKAVVVGGVKLYNENRDTLVKGILEKTAEGIWEEDSLKAMDDKILNNLSKSIQSPADYSAQGAGGGKPANGEQVEIPVEYASRKEEKDA